MPATKCSKFDRAPDEKMGIVRYSKLPANTTKDPSSARFDFNFECADEPYQSLVPHRPWTVQDPVNISTRTPKVFQCAANISLDKTNQNPENPQHAFKFEVGMTPSKGSPYVPDKELVSRLCFDYVCIADALFR
jgi:hypothetical protein